MKNKIPFCSFKTKLLLQADTIIYKKTLLHWANVCKVDNQCVLTLGTEVHQRHVSTVIIIMLILI